MNRAPIQLRSAAVALLTALAAAPLSSAGAQRVSKEPAPPAPDTAWFAVVLNTDTLATESVVRAGGTVSGDLRLLRPRPMAVQYTMFLRSDGGVDSVHTTTVDANVAARGTIVIRPDSAILTMQAPGLTEPQVARIAAPPGALPFINLSAGALDVIFRRARTIDGDAATIPLIAGPQLIPAQIRFVGNDSATVSLGAELRAAVARDGAFLGAVVPAQNVRFVRLAARPASRTAGAPERAAGDPYAAPAGAPYRAENVTIRTPDGATLAGTLTLPRGASAGTPAPVVVTITGSGPQNRDSELTGIGGYAIYRQVADTLGRRGIGVLRLDDRGAGASSALSGSETSETFAGDVRAAVAWLRTRPDVDARRIGLVGHSEGGIIAPMVAAGDTLLRAIALLATQSRPGAELSAHQRQQAIAQDARIPAAARDSMFRVAQAQTDSLVAAGGANAWTRFWWTFDPGPVVRRVRVPVLILHGETDAQVPVAQAEELAAMLRESGNPDVTMRRFPGVNHLFLADPSGHWEGYAALPSKAVPPVILGTIADWFVARLGRGG